MAASAHPSHRPLISGCPLLAACALPLPPNPNPQPPRPARPAPLHPHTPKVCPDALLDDGLLDVTYLVGTTAAAVTMAAKELLLGTGAEGGAAGATKGFAAGDGGGVAAGAGKGKASAAAEEGAAAMALGAMAAAPMGSDDDVVREEGREGQVGGAAATAALPRPAGGTDATQKQLQQEEEVGAPALGPVVVEAT